MKRGQGSVVLDKRSNVWNYFFYENGKQRSKALGRFKTKAAAWRAAKPLRDAVETRKPIAAQPLIPTVATIVEQYRTERMPQRADTNRTYGSWIDVHILPQWGENLITDLQARPVETWLESLPLAPKSRTHIRGILSSLWNYAMWTQAVPLQINPITLVRVKGASKRLRQPRSLTVEQFQTLCDHLKEPFRTIALVCVCFGLRISECLGLRWSSVDWLNGLLRTEHSIVEQTIGDVKTDQSRKSLAIAPELLERLKVWKQTTEFSTDSDWVFASPLKLGRQPYSYTGVWRELQRAAEAAGIGALGTHSFRHSFRMWIDSINSPIGLQQRLMRHTDVRTTMNIYGDASTEDMRQAHGKIVQMALQNPANNRE